MNTVDTSDPFILYNLTAGLNVWIKGYVELINETATQQHKQTNIYIDFNIWGLFTAVGSM